MNLSAVRQAGDFSATGLKVAAAGATGIGFPGKTILISRIIPAGSKAVLERWSAKVIDLADADQIYFAILKNGIPLQSGMERIPGIQFEYQPQIDLNVVLGPGLIEIVAYNISGMSATIEPDALAIATIVNCQAWWSGSLLSERGGF